MSTRITLNQTRHSRFRSEPELFDELPSLLSGADVSGYLTETPKYFHPLQSTLSFQVPAPAHVEHTSDLNPPVLPTDDNQALGVHEADNSHELPPSRATPVEHRRLRDTPARQQASTSTVCRNNRATRGVHFAENTNFRRSTRSVTLGEVQSRLHCTRTATAAASTASREK